MGRRVWGSKRKSYQIKSSLTKVAGGGVATAYEMNQSSSERGREAPSESRSAEEETLRVNEQETRKRGSQQANVIHDHSRLRPEDPKCLDNTQQKTPRASNEKSQNPTLTQKTRSCPICLKPSGVKQKIHIEEVHSDAMFKCRGCPQKYKKYVYNRGRHEKRHHPEPYSAARYNSQSISKDCEVVSNRSG